MMDIVTFLWSLSAASALVLAMVCAFIWLSERANRESLFLCLVGLAATASAYYELQMMRSATPAQYGDWLRWYDVSIYFALIGVLLVVHQYLGAGRRWLLAAIVLMRSIILIVNFWVYPNFNFREIVTLQHVTMLGEQVSTVGVAVTRPWQWLAFASMLLALVYLLDAIAKCWTRSDPESRRKALVVGLGVVAPLVCTAGLIYLVVFGLVRVPVFNTPSFLGALFTLVYEMARSINASRRARQETGVLRTQLAQAERVSVLGQLASTLAHELAQPLTSSITNTDAALQSLKVGKPDPEELREILTDIRRSDGLAADMVARMRQFLRRHTIEMHSISVQEVVHDVVSLVRAQTTSKGISLDLRVQTGLPNACGDRVHLTQVLLNLVMNGIEAVQSVPLDVRRIVIEAHADAAEREIEMSVQDSGPGIPGSIRDKVFQPFFTTKSQGMGMGLALSRTIIEAHGGRLWTEATQDGGTTFRFTLRCA